MTATTLFTHTAAKPHTGYTHRGRNFGHTDAKPGKVHAVNPHVLIRGGWRTHGYLSLCGEFVASVAGNEFGEDTTSHVQSVSAGVAVTCKRCRKLIDAAK